MTFTSNELIAFIGMYWWPFCRIAAMVSIAPIFGARAVPKRIRLGIALCLTVMVAPVLGAHAGADPLSVRGVLTAMGEIFIGLALGFAITLLFAAMVTGGQIIGQLMGLGFASMVDPQNGVSVPVIGQFYVIVATLLFLSMDGHLVMVRLLVHSFAALPVGEGIFAAEGAWELAAAGSWLFAGAVMIALPAIAALLVVNIAFGIMTRAAPQLNIFAVGFAVTIIFGFVIMLVSLSHIMPKFMTLSEQFFDLAGHIVR